MRSDPSTLLAACEGTIADAPRMPGRRADFVRIAKRGPDSRNSSASLDFVLPAGLVRDLPMARRMRHVRPNPQVNRQINSDRPLIFWRDAPGGRREGLMLVAWACPFPECDDRHLDLAVYFLDDSARDVELDDFGIWTVERNGVVSDLEEVLFASFDLDEERLDVGPCARPELAAWLQGELDAEVVAALWERYRSSRARTALLARLLASRRRTRVGRNEPCPCGSRKKYKRCCLGTGAEGRSR